MDIHLVEGARYQPFAPGDWSIPLEGLEYMTPSDSRVPDSRRLEPWNEPRLMTPQEVSEVAARNRQASIVANQNVRLENAAIQSEARWATAGRIGRAALTGGPIAAALSIFVSESIEATRRPRRQQLPIEMDMDDYQDRAANLDINGKDYVLDVIFGEGFSKQFDFGSTFAGKEEGPPAAGIVHRYLSISILNQRAEQEYYGKRQRVQPTGNEAFIVS
jgi:hypothetical protein